MNMIKRNELREPTDRQMIFLIHSLVMTRFIKVLHNRIWKS